MIEHLLMNNVGPSSLLSLNFAPRMNLLTGDNGLGKTFVLDALWWGLTATWAGEKAFPHQRGDEIGKAATITLLHNLFVKNRDGASASTLSVMTGHWQAQSQTWERVAEQRVLQNLTVYARIDGSYAVWDSLYVKDGPPEDAAILLTPHELWDGKEVEDKSLQGGRRTVINGLIADWVRWQEKARSAEFTALKEVLLALSSPDEPLRPGEPTRVHLRDRRDIPTLQTPYGTVPVTLASAGVRRVVALAYLVVWAWTEHQQLARQLNQPPMQTLTLLLDEPELHQHPSWQRVFLPALLRAIGALTGRASLQMFAATHSPLVLASLENVFDHQTDRLFLLERTPTQIDARPLPFGKEGDIANWLASDAFGHLDAR